MKKIFGVIIVLSLISCCYSQESFNSDKSDKEIHLNSDVQKKDYNLKKVNYNNPKLNDDDDDAVNLPFNFMPAPLQLLKQYQDGNI